MSFLRKKLNYVVRNRNNFVCSLQTKSGWFEILFNVQIDLNDCKNGIKTLFWFFYIRLFITLDRRSLTARTASSFTSHDADWLPRHTQIAAPISCNKYIRSIQCFPGKFKLGASAVL